MGRLFIPIISNNSLKFRAYLHDSRMNLKFGGNQVLSGKSVVSRAPPE
jgi:hypothetical protein